jgi:hypothetical protein
MYCRTLYLAPICWIYAAAWTMASGIYSNKLAKSFLDGSTLVTDFGTLVVGHSSQLRYVSRRVGCDINGKWATWNGRNVIWLPPEYRTGVSVIRECASSVIKSCSDLRYVCEAMIRKERWENVDTFPHSWCLL